MQAHVSRTPVPKRCMKDHETMCCKNSTMAELDSCDTDYRVYQKYLLFGSLQKNFANPFTWPLCAHTFTYTCTHTYTHGWVILSMNAPLHIYKLLLHLGGVTFTCHHLFLTSHSPLKALTFFIPPKLLFSQVVKNLVIGKFKGHFWKSLTPSPFLHSSLQLIITPNWQLSLLSTSLTRCYIVLVVVFLCGPSFHSAGREIKAASFCFFHHCSSWTPVSRKMPWQQTWDGLAAMCHLGRHPGGVTWKLESKGGLDGGRETEPSHLQSCPDSRPGGLWVVIPPLTSHCVRSVPGEGHHLGSDRYLCWRKVHRGTQAANAPSGWALLEDRAEHFHPQPICLLPIDECSILHGADTNLCWINHWISSFVHALYPFFFSFYSRIYLFFSFFCKVLLTF